MKRLVHTPQAATQRLVRRCQALRTTFSERRGGAERGDYDTSGEGSLGSDATRQLVPLRGVQ